ncbi:similar to RIKEN cDNA 2610033H07 [Ectocarpus siliculosus]|uniref:Nucleolar protein 14 n=1 Tax=Ectocarpus siliculosus TaxID=2880 RepID=D7FW53_ECTSI|nr:similar to RIKEN cDNA 2610033H07 [Ectocarpus siliculosus]|eukprot:CBJ25573.1 similar to RIKEN cDNA 2610033H07 [Ectocarpus siliculosus]
MKSARKRPTGGDAVLDNPFESRGILNKKHEVFNRRVKGEKRNVARARGQATQRREKTLLVDFERNRKANSFRDKRFGEDDDTLLLEEKMWARMQKDRNQRSRRVGMFNLGDDNGTSEVLTHRGQALGDNDEYGGGRQDDEDDDLDAEVVDQLHFGGDGGGDSRLTHPQGEKTRQEILNDIIARSKERKLEKARGKEEQESERERLDEGMGELLSMLDQRPAKGEGNAARGQSDDYDLTMRELVYEARAQATDRLQTPEEAARAEKARLDKLEKARIERMSSQTVDGDTEGGASVESERRKRKGRNDDELSDEDVGVSASEALGGQDDHSDGSGDSSMSESDSDDNAVAAELDDGEWQSESEGDAEDDPPAQVERCEGKASPAPAARELPYVFACPSSYEGLLALLAEHATSADDINTILDRIHKNHSIKLDSRNKERMHNFYDVLLKRFRRVGSQSGKLSSAARQDRAKQLDFLSGLIYDITAEMPEVAASLWHRVCGSLHQRMVKAMEDLSLGADASGYWPSTGSLLLLKLLVHIFPSTDFRHPVVTPAVLHLSQCLSQCPVKTSTDLSAGVFSCSLVLHCCLGATRLSPEVMVFLTSALSHFTLSPSTQAALSPAFKHSPFGWLRAAAGSCASKDIPAFSMGVVEGLTLPDRQTYAAAMLGALYQLVIQVAHALSENVAFPELFAPLQSVLSKIQPEASPALPLSLQKLHVHLSQQLSTAIQKCASTRSPLQWRAVEPPVLEALAPKFQESYKMKKDGHKDTEQTKFKQLQRQVKRERKGAMRELKRDAVFLEHAKADKTAEKERTRKRRLRDNLTWLEEQQATINQQVKLGGKLIKGGGSSSTKRARVGRGF